MDLFIGRKQLEHSSLVRSWGKIFSDKKNHIYDQAIRATLKNVAQAVVRAISYHYTKPNIFSILQKNSYNEQRMLRSHF